MPWVIFVTPLGRCVHRWPRGVVCIDDRAQSTRPGRFWDMPPADFGIFSRPILGYFPGRFWYNFPTDFGIPAPAIFEHPAGRFSGGRQLEISRAPREIFTTGIANRGCLPRNVSRAKISPAVFEKFPRRILGYSPDRFWDILPTDFGIFPRPVLGYFPHRFWDIAPTDFGIFP